jgi:hypothetical protein
LTTDLIADGSADGSADDSTDGGTPGHFDRMMTRAALAGAGWAELAQTLARHADTVCRVLGPRGEVAAATDGSSSGLDRSEVARVLAGEDPTTVVCADGWPARAARLLAGRRVMGAVLIAEPASDAQIAHLRASITAVLIEAVRRDAAGGGAALTGDVLIDGLRGVLSTNPADLIDTGESLGWDLTRPHCAVALHYAGPAPNRWASALSWLDRPTSREGRFAWTLAVPDRGRELDRIRDQLGTSIDVADQVRGATGGTSTDPRQTGVSFRDADVLLRLVRQGRAPSFPGLDPAVEPTDLLFSRAGLVQLMLAVPTDRLQVFVADHLEPLDGKPELLETLAAWLATGGSRQAVSDRLHLHRNSVGYRVAAIKRLLGVDPLDPALAPVLSAALLARDLLAD